MKVLLLRCFLRLLCFVLPLFATPVAHGQSASGNPVYIGIDAEFGHMTSTSDDAIRAGVRIAVDEINRAGGVLGGRPLAVIEKDNRSVPSRAQANLRELAANPDVVAVFCGKFSPVVLELLPLIHELAIPYLDPWAAADGIVDHAYSPNYVFRLSMRDTWAINRMMAHARSRGHTRVGMLLSNTGWGRSSLKAAEQFVAANPGMSIASVQWLNWGGEKTLVDRHEALRTAGAQALLFVANEDDGVTLVREMSQVPAARRLPVISHWGITGGDFPKLAGAALADIDLAFVQTFTFTATKTKEASKLGEAARRHFNVASERQIPSAVGMVHAYDLTRVLARAIDLARSTDRAKVRAALEQVGSHQGALKTYAQPFTPTRHEALAESDVFMARFAADGSVVRIAERP